MPNTKPLNEVYFQTNGTGVSRRVLVLGENCSPHEIQVAQCLILERIADSLDDIAGSLKKISNAQNRQTN